MTRLAHLTTFFLTAASAAAFTLQNPPHPSTPSPTQLNLFGSKNKNTPSSPQQPPGMLDQLAMFQKAQQIAQKKSALDKELSNELILGTAADGNIQITVQYIPPQLPMNPTPGYEAAKVEIDAGYLEGVSSEELSGALVEAIRDGEGKAAERVAEKYKVLEEDMKGILEGMGGMAGQ